MIRSRRYVVWAGSVAACLAAICIQSAHAQFGPLLSPAQAPQAQSPEELDAYLEIITSRDASTTIKKADFFSSQYAQSQLLGIALQYEMVAYSQLDDLDGVLRAGETALQLQPGNLHTLLTLASYIPTRVAGRKDADKLLKHAEDYAREALSGIDRTKISREIPLNDWEIRKQEMQSEAHEALGQVALERNQLPVAVSELETAIKVSPVPKGSQFLCLGVAYAKAGQKERAQRTLRRASEAGPDVVRKLAEDESAKLTNGGHAPR